MSDFFEKNNIGGILKIGVIVVAIIVILVLVFSTVERNTEGHYVVRQKASGKVDVINEPVFFFAFMAKTWTYDESFEVYLSSSVEDGGKGVDTQPVSVTFSDKAVADVSSVTKILIPRNDDIRLQLHREFRSMDAVRRYARSFVESVLKTSGSFYKGADAYSIRRNEFEVTLRAQLNDGKYAATTDVEIAETGEFDEKGEPIVVKTTVTVVEEKDGIPVISDEGFFNRYGLEVRDFQLKSIDPDKATIARINAEKDQEQDRRLAIQKAETAKQNAITAEEEGKAAIAKEKAEQEVIKTREVTQAEKKKLVAVLAAEEGVEVATLAAEQAKKEAEARLIKEKAEADANALKVKAGLTPQQKAEWEYKTTVDSMKAIADGIAKASYPEIVAGGGGESGSGIDFIEMLGIDSALDIKDRLEK